MARNNLTDKGIEVLAPYFDGNTTFKCLHLFGNKGITNNSVPILNNMLETSNIETLSLNDTSVTELDEIYISLLHNGIKSGAPVLNLRGRLVYLLTLVYD